MEVVRKNVITLAMSTDAQGFGYHATLVASILRRTEGKVWVKCYTRGFAQESFEVGRLKVDFIEATDEVTGNFPPHVPIAVFDRLRVIEDAPEWDRCLVVDHDMICLSDLGEYFDEDFEGNLLMGRLFGSGNTLGLQMQGRGGLPEELEHATDYPYFFMGPMMNLTLMREEGTWQKILEAHALMKQEEQLALTAATGGRVKGVPPKWNQVPQWDVVRDEEGEIERDLDLEGIIHWSGGAKPWHFATKCWRPEIWEAERCNWPTLRMGQWEKPLLVDAADSTIEALHPWMKRGWRVACRRGEHSQLPELAEDAPSMNEEQLQEREKGWHGYQTRLWDELCTHPDTQEKAQPLASFANKPLVLICKEMAQLEELVTKEDEQLPPYLVIREGVDESVAKSLAKLGYDRQWVRRYDAEGALGVGIDYREGPWDGDWPEQPEILASNGKGALC